MLTRMKELQVCDMTGGKGSLKGKPCRQKGVYFLLQRG
jgi:hypothetical protein